MNDFAYDCSMVQWMRWIMQTLRYAACGKQLMPVTLWIQQRRYEHDLDVGVVMWVHMDMAIFPRVGWPARGSRRQ